MYIRIGNTLTEAFACYDRGIGSSPVIGKDFPNFLFKLLFLTFKHTCKLKFTEFMINSCLIKTLPPNQLLHLFYNT